MTTHALATTDGYAVTRAELVALKAKLVIAREALRVIAQELAVNPQATAAHALRRSEP